MIGTITLNPSIDRNLRVLGLVKDDANRAQEVWETAGGKGINVSKVLRELGAPTRAYALLGGFAGDYLKELARSLDFPIVSIPVRGQTRINTVITDIRDKTQTRISAPGPKVTPAEMRGLTRRLLAVRPRPFLWALGGSIAAGMRPEVYRDLILKLQAAGTPCILDTDDEALRLGVQASPYMIKPNEFEMRRLCGRPLRSVADHLGAARQILKRGVRLAVVSLAAKGALFVTRDRAFHALAPEVPVRSNVGAGDSLIGGVAWGLWHKMTLEESAKIGIAASCSAVMREAPRLCEKRDIRALVKRVRIRPF